jgi:ribosomal protein S18 acetylase RimI-like enzyme
MVNLIDLSEENWMDFAGLSVDESQKNYLASNIGIIARGYVYRDSRAKVIGIVADEKPIGLAMVRDMNDEPACYELQQFMIDKNYQGQGYGSEALELILNSLKKERKYDCVEVCVKMEDAQAIHVYEKIGFIDTGYIDEDVPDSYNFVFHFEDCHDKPVATGIRISTVEEAAVKKQISRTILEALPDWFGVPESREQYIKESVSQPFFVAYDSEKPIGFLCLKETGKETVELCVMGVLKDYHRKGVGRKLFEQAREKAKQAGYSFMQVKTVQMGRYEEYDATNHFYLSLGFKEFEVFPTLWDEWNPCQIYVMSI